MILTNDLHQLRMSNDAIAASLTARLQGVDTFAARMDNIERQNTSLLHLLRGGLAILLVLLIIVLILLFLLLGRHA